MTGAAGAVDGGARAVRTGYAVTGALTGISRLHWTLSRRPGAPVGHLAEWSLALAGEVLGG